MATKKDDAWKQFLDMCDNFTMKVEIRKDLEVTALAHQRGVKLAFKEPHPHMHGIWTEKESTQRNVGTMRELAEALLAACDFVDKHNPEWAGKRTST